MENISDKFVASGKDFKFGGLRWLIIGLVFFATLINYIDRLTISVLAPLITKDLNLTNTEFGGIATWFLFAYTISQSLSGKLYDRIGIKKGFSVSIVVWSLDRVKYRNSSDGCLQPGISRTPSPLQSLYPASSSNLFAPAMSHGM